MATQIDRTESTKSPAKARRTRRAPARRTKRSGTANGTGRVAELENIVRTLENRISELMSDRSIRSTVSHATGSIGEVAMRASNHMGDVVADQLTDFAGRIRGSAESVTGVARAGAGALGKIGNEMERRPLMTVAIAIGIGFLAGLAGRREAA